MNKYGMITSGLALGLLAACGGGGGAASDLPGTVMDPPVTTTGDSVMRDASGRVSGVSDGVAFTLSVNEFNANGQPSWQTESERVSSFESDDVFALGGFIDGTPISAVTGTVVDAPLGNATFAGRYAAYNATGFATVSGPADFVFDFEAATLVADTDDFDLETSVAGDGSLTGTATFRGETGAVSGGFFGTDTVAGAFQGEAVAGAFRGTRDQ